MTTNNETRCAFFFIAALAAVGAAAGCTTSDDTPADGDSEASDAAGDSGSPPDGSDGGVSGDTGDTGPATTDGAETTSDDGSTDGATMGDDDDDDDTTDGDTTGEPGGTTMGEDFGTAMSFFVTSNPVFDVVGSDATGDVAGDGDLVFTVPDTDPPVVLRGIEAADAFCLFSAQAVGNPRPNWVAYLSTHGLPDLVDGGDGPQIDARDRIGDGPWYNADEAPLADGNGNVLDLDSLNVELGVVLDQGSDANDPANAAAVAAYNDARLDENLIVDEEGNFVPLNVHDIFTGSDADGRVYDGGYPERWFLNEQNPPPGGRTDWGTCNDWGLHALRCRTRHRVRADRSHRHPRRRLQPGVELRARHRELLGERRRGPRRSGPRILLLAGLRTRSCPPTGSCEEKIGRARSWPASTTLPGHGGGARALDTVGDRIGTDRRVCPTTRRGPRRGDGRSHVRLLG